MALPATFTLASAIGARNLARQGVLPTRLSAVDEAATMDVLCADKTGTLTQNALKVTTVSPMDGADAARVLGLAALASADGGEDPVDAAIRAAASEQKVTTPSTLISFTPFDPATKMSEANVSSSDGPAERVVKGAFSVVTALAAPAGGAKAEADRLEAQGFRVLAVAAGPPSAMKLIGLIALSDPPRAESASLVAKLKALGVRTVMITGDAAATAAIVARAVGLKGPIFPSASIPKDVRPEAFSIFAGILPEDKFKLVKAFQAEGHTVGMCGDGVNDAPALRQAQIGIAVSTATDVAKSAAGMVLTKPGLEGIVAAVNEGRLTFQRVRTYTLNSITKKIVTALFLAFGLVLTRHAVLTPMLMVIIMITGDFLAMSLTTDTVRPSPTPNVWRIGRLTLAGVAMAVFLLAYCLGAVAIGKFALNLGVGQIQTLAFIAVVFGGQAMLYAIRGHQRLWGSRPSLWLCVSSAADISIAGALAMSGLAMTALPAQVVGLTLAAAGVLFLVLAAIKIPVFARLQIA